MENIDPGGVNSMRRAWLVQKSSPLRKPPVTADVIW
jgi:hypothetical protein